MGNPKKKIRTDFRKNRAPRARRGDLTKDFKSQRLDDEDPRLDERLTGKGDLSRRRTITGTESAPSDSPGLDVVPDVDEAACRPGRVLSVFGLTNTVQAEDGRLYRCATRRLLTTLSTDQRHVVAAGDRVLFRAAQAGDETDGIIERIQPRRGCLCREAKGRQHVIVANVDQVVIVTSAAQPRLKPHLVDRLLVAAEKGRLRPLVCINKIDLVEPASLEPLIGVYSRMGYAVLLTSATTGAGVDRLRRGLADRESVVTGQSGVGKSSLLNAVEPGLALAVSAVSEETEKGRHTTTTARLMPLAFGGYVVDTPGIRQFQLWDVIPQEVAGYFRDLRPYINRCKFPNCTHTHEVDCAVKDAVGDGRLDQRRYDSYRQLHAGDMDGA
jgi:ribosome biogenesis GTPase / thiamine phosphate phosphatase